MTKPKINFYSKINEYINANESAMLEKIDLSKEYKFNFPELSTDEHIVEIYGQDDKLVLKGKYSIMGIYNLESSIWVWGHDISFVDKSLVKSIKKIKDLSQDLKDNYKDYIPEQADELYFITSNGNFYLSNENIPKVIKLGTYITNSLWAFPVKYFKDISSNNKKDKNIIKIEYILLEKILQINNI